MAGFTHGNLGTQSLGTNAQGNGQATDVDKYYLDGEVTQTWTQLNVFSNKVAFA
jgi:hypothetical protein